MDRSAATTPGTRRALNGLAMAALACVAIFAGRAEACMICIPFPEKTAADALMHAEVVVLAREDPEKPFSFYAVEVLKGSLAEREIDLFLNSQTRQRLAQEPDRAVVLVRGAAESSSGSSIWRARATNPGNSPDAWRSLGYASPEYESVVRKILANAPLWRGQAGSERRAMFFMPYLSSSERAVRDLAYLEVGMAPYETIRKADGYVSGEQILGFLADELYFEWQSLYILLLGIEATPADREMIRERMGSRARLNFSTHLSAWTAALIEVDGGEAIDWLEVNYLGEPARDPDSVLEVLKAMSVHGNLAAPALRTRIAESYGALIEVHPSLAGWAARDLTAWNDWRFAGELKELRKSGKPLDGATAYAIDSYVRQAKSSAKN